MSDEDGYKPLVQDEANGRARARTREDLDEARSNWIKKAMESPCAKGIDEQFSTQDEKELTRFKETVFAEIYDKIGTDDALAQDLEAALVVKNLKYTPCMATFWTIATLGIFLLLRPADDDSVLVLLKSGRVITFKMERQGFFGGSAVSVIVTFMKYMVVLLTALSLPAVVLWICLSGNAAMEQAGFDKVLNINIDHDMLEKIRRHYLMGSGAFVTFLVVLAVWLWSKCPHDYGSRFRECYSATTVSAGQLTLTGRRNYRTKNMRLYFGRYPTQEMLDQHAVAAGSQGSVLRSIPIKQLAASGNPGGGTRDPDSLQSTSGGGLAKGIILALSIITMLDTTLTWIDRGMAAKEMYTVGKFCKKTPRDRPDQCTRQECRKWAKDNKLPDQFCKTVEYHNKTHDNSQRATCAYYGYSDVPCCGGCGIGEVMGMMKEGGWLAAAQEVLAILADVGTLVFSVMAATAAVAKETTADEFDVHIKQVAYSPDPEKNMKPTSNFELTSPSARNFFEAVFSKSRNPDEVTPRNFLDVSNVEEDQAEDVEQGQPEPTTTTTGVSNFEINKDATTWDEFFDNDVLAERLPGEWYSYRVHVPVRCLGLLPPEECANNPKAEKVIAAWSERPQIELSSLVIPASCAVLLIILLLAAPDSIAEEPIVIPGIGKSPLARVFSAFFLAFCIVGIAVVYQYFNRFVNAVEHAIIVTNYRIFYVRHQAPCFLLCYCGMSLRVDCFRHEQGVVYGNLKNMPLTLLQRITGVRYIPGTVLMQDKFGVLELTRRHGNAHNVFHVISQLIPLKEANFLSKGLDEADSAWNWDTAKADADGGLVKLRTGVCRIKKQEQDLMPNGPEVYLVTEQGYTGVSEVEEPIYHWSFQKAGVMRSPFNNSTDVLVTTGRVFLWNRSMYKRFDCRTSVCWGCCWCGWWSAMAAAKNMPNSVSFFTLSGLLSFSTTTKVEPPVWSDPMHTPIRFPVCESLCNGCTKLCTCNFGEIEQPGLEDFNPLPTRAAPRTQLWMMFRLKTCAQQADLMASIRPYKHSDFEDVDLLRSFQWCQEEMREQVEKEEPEDLKKINTLRSIMGVAQDTAAKRD